MLNKLQMQSVDANHSERTDHPTQKTVEIMEHIVKASCPVDGTVLDPFIGFHYRTLFPSSFGRQNAFGFLL